MRVWCVLLVPVLLVLPAQAQIDICKAERDQCVPAVAFDGANFLVTWQDARDFVTDSSCNIYACRVAPDGQVIDTTDILVACGLRDQYIPRVVRGESDFFIIWQEGC